MKPLFRVLSWIPVLALYLTAAPVPDDARMKELLGVPGKIDFIVGFCDMLDSLEAGQITVLHENLVAGLKQGTLSGRYCETAVELTEQCWVKLNPKGFLESCAARKCRFAKASQQAALAALLATDMESALRLFLLVPLNEDFGERQVFYKNLATIDPARAARFFFETTECERIYDNPIRITYGIWANRDLNAAWASAAGIKNDQWRRPARKTLLEHAADLSIDQWCALIDGIADPRERDSVISSYMLWREGRKPRIDIDIARRLNTRETWNNLARAGSLGKPEETVSKLLEILPDAQRIPVLAEYIKGQSYPQADAQAVEELYAKIADEGIRSAIRLEVTKLKGGTQLPSKDMTDDAALEKLLDDGCADFFAITDGAKRAALAKTLFARFPERSWPWLSQMQDCEGYVMMFDKLAAAWPLEKLPADTSRFLESTERKENQFGIELGCCWMNQDPETAVPVLFSRHVAHAQQLRLRIPFNVLQYKKNWNRAQIEALVDSIDNPTGRDIARRETALYYISRVSPAEALPQILALTDKKDRDKAADAFIRRGVSNSLDAGFLQRIKEIGPEHTEIRDRMLAQLPYEILDSGKADTSLIPEMIAAIRNPKTRMEALKKIRGGDTKAHNEPFVEILATMTPGADRDDLIAGWLQHIPPQDALALANRTSHMVVRVMVLKRLAEIAGLSDSNTADWQAMLESLPAAYRDQRIDNHWFAVKARKDPAANWPELVRRGVESPACRELSLSVIDGWFATNPRSACAACLLIGEPAVRKELLDRCVVKWLSNDPPAAAAWCRGLPPGPVRYDIARTLAGGLRASQPKLADDLLWESMCDLPGFDLYNPQTLLTGDMRASESVAMRIKAMQEARATVRSLADLDFDAVLSNVRDMPAGEAKDLSCLGLLDHAMLRNKDDLAQSLTTTMMESGNPYQVAAAAKTRVGAIAINQPAKALEYAASLDPPAAQLVVAMTIVSRWTAADHRPLIENWIRGYPDVRMRHALAARYLGAFLSAAKQDPQILRPYVDTALQRSAVIAARAAMTDALLDNGIPDAGAVAKADLDEAGRNLLEKWIKELKPIRK